MAQQLSTSPVENPKQRQQLQFQASQKLLNHLQVQLELHGLHHANGGPYIIAPLHESLVDPICLFQLPLPMRFVVRDKIFFLPHIGPAVCNLGHLSINLDEGVMVSYRKILRQASKILENENLVLFPQGSVLGIETAFQIGPFALCKSLAVPMLPVVLSGTHTIWEHPFRPTLRYNQTVYLEILPPIPATRFQTQNLEHLRLETQRHMKSIALGKTQASPRHFKPERDGWWDGYHFEIDPDFTELHQKILMRRQQK